MTKKFAQLANWVAVMSGHPVVFGFAIFTVVAWMVTGPFFSYSDTWQHLDRRRDIFDGVSDPKLAKSRQLGTSSEARRIDPHQRREEFFRGHREAYSGGDRDDSAER